jgi:DNA polymerase-1
VVDTLRSEQETVAALVTREMEAAATLSVALIAEVGVGENWLDAH